MVKWTNLERVWSSWNILQLSSLKMLNILTTLTRNFVVAQSQETITINLWYFQHGILPQGYSFHPPDPSKSVQA